MSNTATNPLSKGWDVKERTYILNKKGTPISFQLRSRHTQYRALTWFDEEENVERALRYATNQRSFFEDEQSEPVVMNAIVFEDGKLIVPAQNTLLQQFLHLHPDNVRNGGSIFKEFDPEEEAQKELKKAKTKFDAFQMVYDSDIEELESAARMFFPERVDRLSSSEIKFDMLRECEKDPGKVVEVLNDPDLMVRNLAAKALRQNLVKFKEDGLSLVWGANGKPIHKFDDVGDQVRALSKYLKTDEGLEVAGTLQNKLT